MRAWVLAAGLLACSPSLTWAQNSTTTCKNVFGQLQCDTRVQPQYEPPQAHQFQQPDPVGSMERGLAAGSTIGAGLYERRVERQQRQQRAEAAQTVSSMVDVCLARLNSSGGANNPAAYAEFDACLKSAQNMQNVLMGR